MEINPWANKLALRRRLYGMKLKENHHIQDHIKSMMEIFEELSVIGDPMEEEDKVVHLLASLPGSFDMLVTALEAHAEVPRLETVTERLMHEEVKLKEKVGISSEETHTTKALFVGERYKNTNNAGNSNGPICYFCNRVGHIKRNCDKLKLKQKEKFKRIQNTNNNSNNDDNKKWTENVHITERKSSDSYNSDSDCAGFVMVGSHALSSVSEFNKNSWLVDSGATSHMCNDKDQFMELKDLKKPEKIKVGDGFSVEARCHGTKELKQNSLN